MNKIEKMQEDVFVNTSFFILWSIRNGGFQWACGENTNEEGVFFRDARITRTKRVFSLGTQE